MRVVLSLLILLGVLMMAAPASAQPDAAATAHSQNAGLVQKVDDRRYNGRRPYYGPRYRSGYYRPYYPPPYAYNILTPILIPTTRLITHRAQA